MDHLLHKWLHHPSEDSSNSHMMEMLWKEVKWKMRCWRKSHLGWFPRLVLIVPFSFKSIPVGCNLSSDNWRFFRTSIGGYEREQFTKLLSSPSRDSTEFCRIRISVVFCPTYQRSGKLGLFHLEWQILVVYHVRSIPVQAWLCYFFKTKKRNISRTWQ